MSSHIVSLLTQVGCEQLEGTKAFAEKRFELAGKMDKKPKYTSCTDRGYTRFFS